MGRLRPKGLKPLAPGQQLEEGSQARLLGHEAHCLAKGLKAEALGQ